MLTVYDFVVDAHDLPNMSMFKCGIEELGLNYKISKWTTIVPSFFDTHNPQFDTVQEDGVFYFERACHYALQVVHDDGCKDALNAKMWSVMDMLTNEYNRTGIALETISHRE